MNEQNQTTTPARSRSEQAVGIIIREHQGLWRVIDLLEQLQQDMNVNDQRPDEVLFNTIFDYIQHFSNRVHSQPTEIVLYKKLREKSPESGPLLDKLERGYVVGHEKLTNFASSWRPASMAGPMAGRPSAMR